MNCPGTRPERVGKWPSFGEEKVRRKVLSPLRCRTATDMAEVVDVCREYGGLLLELRIHMVESRVVKRMVTRLSSIEVQDSISVASV